MTAIARRSITCPISIAAELAAADDLNGVQDNTKSFDVTGALRVIVIQSNDGTAGTAGIDGVAISHDGGTNWTLDTTVLPLSENDVTGTIQANGLLNSAGTEPTAYAAFKCGPYEGPTAIRIFRYVTDMANTAAWSTGAPSVDVFTIGQTSGALTALA